MSNSQLDPNKSAGQARLDRDVLSIGRLENLAFQLAESHAVSRRPRRRPPLLDHLREQEALLREAYRYFAKASEAQCTLSYAAEWLLDNFYVVEHALRQIREDMLKGYYRQLPKLGTSSLQGYPRTYALAREIIGYCESHLDLDQVRRFVQAYQRVMPLTMGELWALPTMLRLGVLEDLARAVASIAGLETGKSARLSDAAVPLSEDLDDAVVANCILSLRMLATQDWKAFFESVSRVEQVLRRDPADIYTRMDFDTRNRYRGVIEELALGAGQGEEEVAREAIRLAQNEVAQNKEGGNASRTTHVGFYLLDVGRTRLETRLGCRPFWRIRLSRWLLGHPTLVYLGSITLLTLVVLLGLIGYALVVGGTLIQLIGVGFLTVLPATSVAVNMVNWLVTQTVPPRVLPRLDFQEGIPAKYRTMVVVPALLTDADQVQPLLQQLELYFLGNTDPHLHLALLADLYDAPQRRMSGDDALLEQAKAGIQALNEKYGQPDAGPFYLFYRERQWNPAEDYWMGWERKRGKLVEFNRLLGGKEASYSVQMGDLDVLPKVKYVITLDADTLLPRDGARRLIATLAHPLNQAELDPDRGAVVAGYTVLQPRVEIMPTSAGRSLLARVFSGDTGVDLYTRAASDVYQDLFGEGSYAGKGIYDVAAFERSLAGRAPDNALLSHDLFEGIHGRVGLVTDVILYEDYPSHYLAYTHRLQRWVRGDWQLLPWLLPRVPHAGEGKIPNDLSTLDRWKILDNLRRSLSPPALLALLVLGWLWFPGSALAWTLAGMLALAAPVFADVATVLRQALRRASLTMTAQSIWIDTIRWLLALAFLPYETLVMIDAIATTLVRLAITRQRLLQWTTAAHAIRLFDKETQLGSLWKQMGAVSLLASGLAWLVILGKPAVLPVAAPLLLAWAASPYIAHRISQPVAHKQTPLSAAQRRQLGRLARRTWLYFERFVGQGDHWLPPDHFQEKPLELVAHRTSPTNLGLLLLSTLGAYDLGYIGPLDLALRLHLTFKSMSKLERYRGHFLNWYDTRNLGPLPPRCVSSVDSGNLAGCLLALKQGCLAIPHEPVLRWQRWQGVLDGLDVLAEIVESLDEAALKTVIAPLQDYLEHICQQVLAVQDDPDRWAPLLARLCSDGWQELERLSTSLVESGSPILEAAALRDLHIWSERVYHQLVSMQDELDLLLPWLLPLSQPPALFVRPETDPAVSSAWQALADALPTTPRLDEVPEVCQAGQRRLGQLQGILVERVGQTDQARPELCPELVEGLADQVKEARDWCTRLAERLDPARSAVQSLLIRFQGLCAEAEAYFLAMDFSCLFDPHRQVFHVGYNVETGTLDSNGLDSLACEAQIASLLAIAKGDVPQSHWLHLARPITRINGARALLSWGGSMLEYLMPSLLIESYEGTLLEQSGRVAVHHQMTYARRKGVPWGISESGYYRLDANKDYQYQVFGVPGLGFKRGLGEDLVIAPYASLLAFPLCPQAVMQNVAHLIELQMLGRYGFYEAIDYTDSRLPPGQRSAIVRSYMAHHQGMILVSLVNRLRDEAMVRRFHADPRVQSVQLLLHEQVPHQAAVEYPHPEEIRAVRRVQPLDAITPRRVRVKIPTP